MPSGNEKSSRESKIEKRIHEYLEDMSLIMSLQKHYKDTWIKISIIYLSLYCH